MKNFYVYMLLAKSNNKYLTYVGYTDNPNRRLNLHNSSKGAKFTKGRKWKFIYLKKYNSKICALRHENLLKNDRKKRNNIKKLFTN